MNKFINSRKPSQRGMGAVGALVVLAYAAFLGQSFYVGDLLFSNVKDVGTAFASLVAVISFVWLVHLQLGLRKEKLRSHRAEQSMRRDHQEAQFRERNARSTGVRAKVNNSLHAEQRRTTAAADEQRSTSDTPMLLTPVYASVGEIPKHSSHSSSSNWDSSSRSDCSSSSYTSDSSSSSSCGGGDGGGGGGD